MSEENQTLELEVIQESKSQMTASSDSRQLATTPGDFLAIAVNRGASIEELKMLMDLKDRWDASEAKKAYVAAMAQFKQNAPDIEKTKLVEHSGIRFYHATLGTICEIAIPILAQFGFSHRWETEQLHDGMIRVVCIITHALGHSERTALEAPPDNSGKKNSIQSIASTISYLERYTFLGACGLSTIDMDNDGRGDETGGANDKSEAPKETLSKKGFSMAEESVKKGEWSKADIVAKYKLTTDQEIALDDAEREFKSSAK